MASDDEAAMCPLCAEEMDATDKRFQPCQCGYQIHEVAAAEALEALCPNCRRPYDKDAIPKQADVAGVGGAAVQRDSVASRRHLASVRVIQRNLVYVIGLPLPITREETLRRPEYFGQFGRIVKVATNRANTFNTGTGPTASAYVTYARAEDAQLCIECVDGCVMEGRVLRACFGTTKYCNAFLKNVPCNNPDCLYLHEKGGESDSFTKEEMVTRQSRGHGGQTPGDFHTATHTKGGGSARQLKVMPGAQMPVHTRGHALVGAEGR
eukprot:PRCOL_00003222-RA